ncbi:MAG: DUF3429 domain-containing protein [Alphaproteobacteria bacterium]|nr:DUF3429 domain-containing protein [Alphaproteobacteria bacterium]MBU0797213.1 DUF3429 domain-containing protein [Alphaproteobacteria bacterium]MBU0888999.1 DUF3429 domain-containing protein [Alphaproteobacteria bacterium]MBU1814019.1 DUF3429 domain-containing protein [Alphaproteobacteria bacterium]
MSLRQQFSGIPRPVLLLGLGGLIPFIAGAVGGWTLIEPLNRAAQDMQVAYAALILSFLGAVHWGAALSRPDGARHWGWMAWSVTPALTAWVAIMPPAPVALMILMAGFLVCLAVDIRAVQLGLLPRWYLGLRRVLTPIVLICLGATLLRLT